MRAWPRPRHARTRDPPPGSKPLAEGPPSRARENGSEKVNAAPLAPAVSIGSRRAAVADSFFVISGSGRRWSSGGR
jgi:hypothetical protein